MGVHRRAFRIAILMIASAIVQPISAEQSKNSVNASSKPSNKQATAEDGLAPPSAPRPQQIEPIVEPVKRMSPQTPPNKAKARADTAKEKTPNKSAAAKEKTASQENSKKKR